MGILNSHPGILAVGSGQRVQLIDLSSQEPHYHSSDRCTEDLAQGPENHILGITAISGSCVVAACCKFSNVVLYNVKKDKIVSILKGHSDMVYGCDFLPRHSLLASAGRDEAVRLWRVDPHRPSDACFVTSLESVSPYSSDVIDRVRSGGDVWPDRLLTTSPGPMGGNCVGKVWDVQRSEQIGVLSGHQNAVKGIEISNSSDDGQVLMTGGKDATARLWDPATFQEVACTDIEDPVCSSFCPTQRDHLFVLTGTQSVMLMDIRKFSEILRRWCSGSETLNGSCEIDKDRLAVSTAAVTGPFVFVYSYQGGELFQDHLIEGNSYGVCFVPSKRK